MVNDAGGIKSQGSAKLNLIVSDVQSDTTVTRTETDELISGNKLSAIHGCFASALTLIASEVAERAKVPLLTGSELGPTQQGPPLPVHSLRPRIAICPGPATNGEMGVRRRQPKVAVLFENTAFGAPASNGLREQPPARSGNCPVRALLGRPDRRQPAD